jgi:predicted membrane channel-forming protein YqfA (hemolysin III family)
MNCGRGLSSVVFQFLKSQNPFFLLVLIIVNKKGNFTVVLSTFWLNLVVETKVVCYIIMCKTIIKLWPLSSMHNISPALILLLTLTKEGAVYINFMPFNVVRNAVNYYNRRVYFQHDFFN